jgi:putative heme iron utilization protein
LVQQETIKETVGKLVYPFGVGTLASDDRRFRAAGDRSAKSGWEYNGPAWTWLAGQFTYALTRYDRQDFSFQLTEAMAKSALAEGIVGTIPEMYAAVPSDGAAGPSGEGRQASLTGMTQFLSSWEQNYLGVRVDATANLLSLEPKLPPGITSAEFTIMMGSHSISGAITRQENLTRITLFAPDLARDLDCSILWVLDDGDAWKIAAGLPRGVRLNMALGPDDVAASLGDKRTDLKEVRRLSKFSLKGVFSGVKFANAGN